MTGKKYEEAVREMVLRPAGITRMKLGKTRLANRAAGEVVYHTREGDKRYKSVFPDVKQLVEEPYGDFYLGALDRTAAGSRRPPIWSALPPPYTGSARRGSSGPNRSPRSRASPIRRSIWRQQERPLLRSGVGDRRAAQRKVLVPRRLLAGTRTC